jgi:hypothetical protein
LRVSDGILFEVHPQRLILRDPGEQIDALSPRGALPGIEGAIEVL